MDKNIDFLLNMTKSYLDGAMESFEYIQDFPYELDQRYKKIARKNRGLADLIYDCLLENGVYLYDELSEEEFKEKIAREYKYVNGVCCGDVDLI